MRKLIAGLVVVLTLFACTHAFAGIMFWTDGGSVYRANMDGTAVKIHDNSDGYTGWIDVDPIARKLYLRGEVVGGGAGVIRRMNYDGTSLEAVLPGLNFGGYGFALDIANQTMYFGDYPNGAFVANLDGSDMTVLPNTSGGVQMLRHTLDYLVVGDKLYYTNSEFVQLSQFNDYFQGIRRADLDGSNIEVIHADNTTLNGFHLAVDETTSTLYWSDEKANVIYRTNLDGSSRQTVYSVSTPYDVEVDFVASKLYFTTKTYLGRINLDGTGFELLADLMSPGGVKELALDPFDHIAVDIDIKPGAYPNSVNLGSKGLVPVAILSSEDFDAAWIDADTIVMASAGVAIRGKGNNTLAKLEDVNGDGLADLVCHIETENFDPGAFDDGWACLEGQTFEEFGGESFEGCDEITIVPPE